MTHLHKDMRTVPKRFFLTHSSKDKPVVLRVGRALAALGYTVWIDKFEIQAGDSLIKKVFEEGLQKTDYVCAFITSHSTRSKWVREELEFAFHRSIEEGKPKIVMLQFGGAKVPVFLKHKLYAKLQAFELGSTVRQILASAHLRPMKDPKKAAPYATLDFHDAHASGDIVYLLASRRDDLDVEPFYDMENVEFPLRYIFVLKVNTIDGWIVAHHLAKARLAHTAMRLDGNDLRVFYNAKMQNHTFAMNGYLYRLLADTLRPTAVNDVFLGRNWGWSPWIDENGLVHHGDSETPGNPYLIDQAIVAGKHWRDLGPVVDAWRAAHCPYPNLQGPDRKTGYLRFLDVDRGALS